MRRDLLPPPRMVQPDTSGVWPLDAPGPELPDILAEPSPCGDRMPIETGMARDRLGEPKGARKKRRFFFDPQSGWFRKLERDASHFLCRHVYHRIPLISRPYDWMLEHRLTLSEGEVPVRGLPAAFDGLRVLLMSDMHAGPFVSPRALQRALARLASTDPDLILIGGDLTTSHLGEFVSHAAAFRQLGAPLGVYGVLGNHDHYTGDPAGLRRLIEGETDIRMLHNAAVELERDGERLTLAGVDDLNRGRPDLDAALDGAREPVLLMSHNPDLFFAAARRGVALTLSGHTHGGQIRLPRLPVLVRQSRYRLDEGRYRYRNAELVVSRGLGAVGIPWRAACPPEGVLLTLRPSPA